jgi:hypothetical protein
VFVFPLVEDAHPFLDLASMLSVDLALRPTRQSCGLLGGAGNLARNYCARYVGLKLRLGPQFALRDPTPASFYFPSEGRDTALSTLLEAELGAPTRHYPATRVVQ